MSTRNRLATAAIGLTAVATGPGFVIAATYVVRGGDTLSEIAVRHGTTVGALVDANALNNPNALRVGQLLHIPDNALGLPAYTARGNDTDVYTIEPHQDVIRIARSFGVDPTALARANGIRITSPLHVGSTLQVPGRLGRVNALLTQTSVEVGVDPRLVRAVAWNESGWQQTVVSPTGAVGIMQIEPYTGGWVSRYLAGRSLDIHRAVDNVLAGALLLHHHVNVHGGDTTGALADYYQGSKSVATHGLYDDTKQYQRVVGALLTRG